MRVAASSPALVLWRLPTQPQSWLRLCREPVASRSRKLHHQFDQPLNQRASASKRLALLTRDQLKRRRGNLSFPRISGELYIHENAYSCNCTLILGADGSRSTYTL